MKTWQKLGAGLFLGLAIVAGSILGGYTISQAQGATPQGILPLRIEPSHAGAGITTDALLGDYCSDAQYVVAGTPVPNRPADNTANSYIRLNCQKQTVNGAVPNPPTDTTVTWDFPLFHANSYTLTTAAVKQVLTGSNGLTTDNILDGTLTGHDIHDSSIFNADLGADAVSGNVVQNGSLQEPDYASGSVSNRVLGLQAVGTNNVEDGAITRVKLAPGVAGGDSIREFILGFYRDRPATVTQDQNTLPVDTLIGPPDGSDPGYNRDFTNNSSRSVYGDADDPIVSRVITDGVEGDGTTFTLPAGIYRLKFNGRVNETANINANRTVSITLGFDGMTGSRQVATIERNGSRDFETTIDDLVVSAPLTRTAFFLEISAPVGTLTRPNQVTIQTLTAELWRKG